MNEIQQASIESRQNGSTDYMTRMTGQRQYQLHQVQSLHCSCCSVSLVLSSHRLHIILYRLGRLVDAEPCDTLDSLCVPSRPTSDPSFSAICQMLLVALDYDNAGNHTNSQMVIMQC